MVDAKIDMLRMELEDKLAMIKVRGVGGRGGAGGGAVGMRREERESGPRAFVRCAPVASFASSLSPILPPQNATFGVKDMAEDKVVGLVNITAGLKGEVADKIEGVMTGFKN
jgi:hypothetical protein